MTIKIDWQGHPPDPEGEKIVLDADGRREMAMREAKKIAANHYGNQTIDIEIQGAAVRKKGFCFLYKNGTYIYLGKNLSEEEIAKAMGASKTAQRIYQN